MRFRSQREVPSRSAGGHGPAVFESTVGTHVDPDTSCKRLERQERLPFYVVWSILPMYHRTEVRNDKADAVEAVCYTNP